MRKAVAIVLVSIVSSLILPLAHGQVYPTKLIRIIVPYPPVGSNDLFARLIAQKLTESFGVQTIVDNRAGADGIIGVEAVPELPTIAETGFPEYELSVWYGLLVPAGTPRVIIGKLNSEIVKIVRSPDITTRLESVGVEPLTNTPEEFADFVKGDVAKWSKVVKESGARVE